MSVPVDYVQLPSGFWVKVSDGTGPYIRTADLTFVLVSSGGGGGGGDATAANQVTGNATLTTISGKLPASLGAKAPSASLSVTLALGAGANMSGSITTGGTAQNAAAANASRRGFEIQNISGGDLWVSDVGTAAVDTAGSFKLPAGASYYTQPGECGVGVISIVGAVTGQKWTGREW
jgi:hypothetical protein